MKMPSSLKVLGVLGGMALAAALLVAPATATHTGPLTDPILFQGPGAPGNPQCADLNSAWTEVKDENAPFSGTLNYTLPAGGGTGTITYTYSGDTTRLFSFSITGPAVVGAVILKAGNDANVYRYDIANATPPPAYTPPAAGGVNHDNNLTPPNNNNGLSHVSFCIKPGLALAVAAHSLKASRVGKSVTLRWRTASEHDTLGFVVFRKTKGKLVKLSKRVIPAASLAGSSTTHAYSFRAKLASKRLAASSRYVLAEVHLNGTRTWYGPVRAHAAS